MKIFYQDRVVAQIRRENNNPDRLTLTYEDAWLKSEDAFPVSLSLHQNSDDGLIMAWLANLLPEGDQLNTLTRTFGSDALRLVQKMGLDTAGALTFSTSSQPDYLHLKENDLERIINELPRKPFLAGQRGVHMSLSGAQYKLPVALFDGKIYLPINGAASTHILKPDNRTLADINRNEATCLSLAERVLHNPVRHTLGKAGARHYLLVERYDRVVHADGVVSRIHQEDFCQALGLPPSCKYETAGLSFLIGPDRRNSSLRGLFSVARRINSVIPLLEAVIFNTLIGNSDSHAKNYSVILAAKAKFSLAPLYDLVCSMPYSSQRCGGITQALPQLIGGKLLPYELRRKQWISLADDLDISRETVLDTIATLAQSIAHHVRELEKDARLSSDVLACIMRRSRHIETLAARPEKRATRTKEQVKERNPLHRVALLLVIVSTCYPRVCGEHDIQIIRKAEPFRLIPAHVKNATQTIISRIRRRALSLCSDGLGAYDHRAGWPRSRNFFSKKASAAGVSTPVSSSHVPGFVTTEM